MTEKWREDLEEIEWTSHKKAVGAELESYRISVAVAQFVGTPKARAVRFNAKITIDSKGRPRWLTIIMDNGIGYDSPVKFFKKEIEFKKKYYIGGVEDIPFYMLDEIWSTATGISALMETEDIADKIPGLQKYFRKRRHRSHGDLRVYEDIF